MILLIKSSQSSFTLFKYLRQYSRDQIFVLRPFLKGTFFLLTFRFKTIQFMSKKNSSDYETKECLHFFFYLRSQFIWSVIYFAKHFLYASIKEKSIFCLFFVLSASITFLDIVFVTIAEYWSFLLRIFITKDESWNECDFIIWYLAKFDFIFYIYSKEISCF